MRDAFMASVIDHASRNDVSDGSRGIIPGIENVGQNPALMQEALAMPADQRAAALEEFIAKHRDTRAVKFGGNARFDDKTLKIEEQI